MEDVEVARIVRRHLLVVAAVTCVTAYFSYVFFHNDEHFQIIEFVRSKRGDIAPVFLPWEHAAHMRPWLQPLFYWVISRVLAAVGIEDIFQLGFAFRLVTGLANLGALALFLRTTMPWMRSDAEKLAHVRVATLTGFFPYLFVRTSSESASMALATAGFALLLEGAAAEERTWSVPSLARTSRALLVGLLFGLAFEMRYQSAFLLAGIAAWLVLVARAPLRAHAWLLAGFALAIATGALADRWGYGQWVFPPWHYVRVNLIEGAAKEYGTDPPLAYFWLLPGNVFFPTVVAFIVLACLAWLRCPRHPVTWATLPFFAIHNLIAHKEERFLFPIAVLSTALVTMAAGPSFAREGWTVRAARALWPLRERWPAKVLAATSFAGMALLAFYPLGWNQHARFMKFVHDRFGDELVAAALPDVDVTLPAYHPRIYDVINEKPEETARRLEAGTARRWLIADDPVLRTGTIVDTRAVVVFSELPRFADPSWVDAYNARAPAALRRLRFRTLYELR
ncbi:MAG: hypothetical protein U0270_35550 [Labilithrix sp.]